jgi:hypothetical protein
VGFSVFNDIKVSESHSQAVRGSQERTSISRGRLSIKSFFHKTRFHEPRYKQRSRPLPSSPTPSQRHSWTTSCASSTLTSAYAEFRFKTQSSVHYRELTRRSLYNELIYSLNKETLTSQKISISQVRNMAGSAYRMHKEQSQLKNDSWKQPCDKIMAFVEKTDEMVTTKRDEQRNGEQRSGDWRKQHKGSNQKQKPKQPSRGSCFICRQKKKKMTQGWVVNGESPR